MAPGDWNYVHVKLEYLVIYTIISCTLCGIGLVLNSYMYSLVYYNRGIIVGDNSENKIENKFAIMHISTDFSNDIFGNESNKSNVSNP